MATISAHGQRLRDRLTRACLYLCTDARRDSGDLAEFVDAALRGGVDIVQLRDKQAGQPALEAREELAALAIIAQACHRHGALFAVNDRADIALTAGADVLHLGQDDLTPAQARRIVGDDMIIGLSSHSVDQAGAAATEPLADYFCTGPCWPTPTKPGRPAPGLDLVRDTAHREHDRPFFAIGGIDANRLPSVLEAGATRIVVVRAITESTNPEQAARDLVEALTVTAN